MAASSSKYPVSFSVEYPEKLNRLKTFFRLVLIIPIFIVFLLLIDINLNVEKANIVFGPVGFLFLAPLVMILFRRKYPRWWFNWNLELFRFTYRIHCYFFLLRDEYPSTDEQQAVSLNIKYPNAKQLNRFLPLVKWILVIPHMIILMLLTFVALIVWILAWFAILFTGRYPRVFFDFLIGYLRWMARVVCYAFILTTDEYPPFSLEP